MLNSERNCDKYVVVIVLRRILVAIESISVQTSILLFIDGSICGNTRSNTLERWRMCKKTSFSSHFFANSAKFSSGTGSRHTRWYRNMISIFSFSEIQNGFRVAQTADRTEFRWKCNRQLAVHGQVKLPSEAINWKWQTKQWKWQIIIINLCWRRRRSRRRRRTKVSSMTLTTTMTRETIATNQICAQTYVTCTSCEVHRRRLQCNRH